MWIIMAEDGSTMEPSGRRSTHALEQRLHPPYAAEQIAAEVICSHELPTPLVWIEHWSKESTGRGEETFELVVFSSYEVEERAPYLEETRARIGRATWKSLDRRTVEVLIWQKV